MDSLKDIKQNKSLNINSDRIKEELVNYFDNISKEDLIEDLKEVEIGVMKNNNYTNYFWVDVFNNVIKERDSLLEENDLLRFAIFELTNFIYENPECDSLKYKAIIVQEIILDYNKRYFDIEYGKEKIREVLQ